MSAPSTIVPSPSSSYDDYGRLQLSVGVKRAYDFDQEGEIHGWSINLQANRAYRVTLYDPTVHEDHTHQGIYISNIDTSGTGSESTLPSDHTHGARNIGIAKIADEDGAALRFLNTQTIGGPFDRLSPNYLNDPSDPGPTTNVFIAKRTGPHYIFAYSVIADVNYSIKVSEIMDLPNNPSPSARPLYWIGGTIGTDNPPSYYVWGSWVGAIQSNNDVDWYRVQLNANRAYSFRVASLLSSGANSTAQFKVKGLVGPDGITKVGDTGAGRTSFSYFVPRGAGGTYFVGAANMRQSDIGFYSIIVEETDVPDNTGGPSLRVGERYASYINHRGDQDWYRIELDSTRNYRIRANGGWGNNGLVKTLSIKKPRDGTMNNMEVSSGFTSTPLTSYPPNVRPAYKAATFKPSASGTYYIVISHSSAGSGGLQVGGYYVRVEDTGPR